MPKARSAQFESSGNGRLPEFFWTKKEAESAWIEGRLKNNIAKMLPDSSDLFQYVSGGFMVDGWPATVYVCRDESIKQRISTPSQREKYDKEQDQIERQKWASLCLNS
jgi:hypothetical protein